MAKNDNVNSTHNFLVEQLLGWDKFERKSSKLSIIDFNLLGANWVPKKYTSRYQILNDLKRSCKLKDVSNSVKAKITANVTYLRSLMGQRYAFKDYILNTQHIPTIEFQEIYLSSIKNRFCKALDNLSVRYDRNSIRSLDLQESKIKLHDIGDYFTQVFSEEKTKLEDIIGQSIEFELEIELAEEDAYWSYWVDGKGSNFRLRFNKSNKDYPLTEAIQFIYHELLEHCSQMALWKREIDCRRMSPVWGLTCVHGPEQFLFEGLAQTLPLYIKSEKSNTSMMETRILLSLLSYLISNNVHLYINEGKSIEYCLKFAKKYLPWIRNDRFAEGLKSKSNDVLFRSYQYVYSQSFDFFYRMSSKLNDKEKKHFLNKCYKEVLLFDDLTKNFS